MDRAKLVREIRGWTLTILAVLAFRIFLYEAVYIPSGSMIPTLQIGDYVIVEKWAYGARIPFTPTAQATWRNPRRGDIVVLLAPPGNPRDDDLIKRVVGTEGDVVGIRDGHLVINGEPVPRERVPGTCTYEDKTEDGVWHVEPCADFVERLGTRVYHTYCTPHRPCGDGRAHEDPASTRLGRRRPPRPLRRQPGIRPGAGRPPQGSRLDGARLVGSARPTLGPSVPIREPLAKGLPARVTARVRSLVDVLCAAFLSA